MDFAALVILEYTYKNGSAADAAIFRVEAIKACSLYGQVDPLAANVVLYHLEENAKSEKTDQPGRIVKGPAGLAFAEDFAILPHIIEELWRERDRAKKVRDEALSYAVKIIMNSFYGVLGSLGCRFFDPRLAGTITRIGHWTLNVSRAFIEERG